MKKPREWLAFQATLSVLTRSTALRWNANLTFYVTHNQGGSAKRIPVAYDAEHRNQQKMAGLSYVILRLDSKKICEVIMVVETRYEHVVLNKANVPVIFGSTMKVIELALAHLAYGWSPDELLFQFPHLTLGQIYSALAYYWDHREELDQDIENRISSIDSLRGSLGESPLVAKLKTKGLI